MIQLLEIHFWKIAKWLIRRGYGAYCQTSDIDDFPETFKNPKSVFSQSRCGSCRAKEIIEWIDGHIELLRM